MYQYENQCLDECPCERAGDCCQERRCRRIVAAILSAILAFSLGTLFGALASAIVLGSLAAVIVFIAIVFILTVLSVFLLYCRKCR